MTKKKEYVRMNPEVKALWVNALRSGKYKKTTGQLRETQFNPDGSASGASFCCLGVLCNLHAQLHPKIAAKQKDPHSYLGEGELLPFDVAKWAGLPIDKARLGPAVNINGEEDSLANHNDNGRSFKQIAHAINIQL